MLCGSLEFHGTSNGSCFGVTYREVYEPGEGGMIEIEDYRVCASWLLKMSGNKDHAIPEIREQLYAQMMGWA